MAADQDSWIHSALGVDVGSIVSTVESAVSSSSQPAGDENASTDSPKPPQVASTAPDSSGDTPAGPPPPDDAPLASGPDSDSYKRGYQDGLSGQDANPGPLAPDSLTDYQEGYTKGQYEFNQKNASQVPDGPNSSEGPPYSPAPPPPPTDPGPNQTVTTDEDRAAYQKGYQDGLSGADADPIGQAGFQYAQDYTSGYNAGKADRRNVPAPPSPNTNDPNSKEYLIKEIEDLGGPCYDPDAMSYDDLKKKYEELKQRSGGDSPDNGQAAEPAKSREETEEDRKREEDAEEQRREFLKELGQEIPESEKEREGEFPEMPEMPVGE